MNRGGVIAAAVVGAAIAVPAAFHFGTQLLVRAGSDPGMTSHNIQASPSLRPTAENPYAGFWKVDCGDDFGLAIAAAGKGMYSVSFCGPGGCFKPGTYRPDTTLLNDSDYAVDAADQIGVKGRGGSFTAYVRCSPK
ncbi:MAG: hypothetical protein JSR18_01430 [Proteobacteria bacterium]|nr:hypothetical protein [Pseudomonadota bacterium]